MRIKEAFVYPRELLSFVVANYDIVIAFFVSLVLVPSCFLVGTIGYILLRDILFRLFVIRPETNFLGDYACYIEDDSISRWVTNEKINSDIVFLGNSHVMDAINPSVVASLTGRSCFNFCFYSINFPNLLRLAVEKEIAPKILVVDISTRYSMYDDVQMERLRRLAAPYGKKKLLLHGFSDVASAFLPSFFVPKMFTPIVNRLSSKVFYAFKDGVISCGRYSPFRTLFSYEWRVHKKTNYREVIHKAPKKKFEIREYDKLLNRCIEETKLYCPIGSDKYIKSFSKMTKYSLLLKSKEVRLIFLRLPLDPRMIEFENTSYNVFFQDFKNWSLRHGFEYFDLSEKDHLDQIGDVVFYNDGLHVISESSVKISKYMAEILNFRGGNLDKSILN